MKIKIKNGMALFALFAFLILLQEGCKKEENNDNNNDPGPVTGTVTDIDGNVYQTVKIGEQTWMTEALMTTRYNDGSQINNAVAGYYTFDELGLTTRTSRMGKEVISTKTKKICPEGWHIPSKDEWTELYGFIAHDNNGAYGIKVGKALKSKTGWAGPGTGDDIYGFNARATGAYNPDSAKVTGIGKSTYLLSGDNDHSGPWLRAMYNFNDSFHETTGWFEAGYTVRCLKDK